MENGVVYRKVYNKHAKNRCATLVGCVSGAHYFLILQRVGEI